MKRNFYILALALIATFSANASTFYLHFTRPASYTVSIDGIYYQVNGLNLRINSIRPGRHYITIESFAPTRNQYRRPMPVLVFRGPLIVRDFSDIFASVDGCGFHVDRVIKHRQQNNYNYHYRYNDHNNQYYEFNDNDRKNQNQNNEDSYNYDNRNNNDDRDNNNNYDWDNRQDYNQQNDNYNQNNGYGNSRYMNTRDFDALKQSINNASFESTKRTVAMSGIAQNSLSVEQIKDVIMLFSFESTKLEIAKYAYNYTPDKNKYYQLNDAFSFDSSKNEIAQLTGTR